VELVASNFVVLFAFVDVVIFLPPNAFVECFVPGSFLSWVKGETNTFLNKKVDIEKK